MKRLIVLITAAGLLAAACGDSGGAASSCDALVDDGLELVQEMLDELSGMTFEDIAALGDEPPPALADLEERGAQLETRAQELNCSDAELDARFQEKVGDLTADGPFAELILEGIQSESFFSE